MYKQKKLKIALIFGGTSQERAVSLVSGKTVAQNLDAKKYDIYPVEIASDGKWLIDSPTIRSIGKFMPVKKIKSSRELVALEKNQVSKIDIAFLALHGPGGEDGTIQGMLELLKIPYTCSGVLASALAMDKALTKRLVATLGTVNVLPHILIERGEYKKRGGSLLSKIKGTVVTKPNRVGSSLGVTITDQKKQIRLGITKALRLDNEILIEAFVTGREITVPVLGNLNPTALPAIEIIPWKKSKFYDYQAKYAVGGSEHVIPAPLTASQTRAVQAQAVAVHKLLGCRGVTRSDFILGRDGKFYFLEINTIPGMTPTSLMPQSAAFAGISYAELLDKLIKLGLE